MGVDSNTGVRFTVVSGDIERVARGSFPVTNGEVPISTSFQYTWVFKVKTGGPPFNLTSQM